MVRAFRPIAAASLAGLLALAGCSSTEGLGSSSSELVDNAGGRQLSEKTVETLVRNAGFTGASVLRMVCIAYYESGWNDLSLRSKPNGTWSIGLFAINTVHVGNTPNCPAKAEQLYDINANTKCARAIYEMHGLRGFPSYAQNKAECDAYRIQQAP